VCCWLENDVEATFKGEKEKDTDDLLNFIRLTIYIVLLSSNLEYHKDDDSFIF
jgi:hypothetical protein